MKVKDYIKGVRTGDRTTLARTITLMESNTAYHIEQAQEVLKELLPFTGKSIRIGITGAPGAGKSTFIESFGNYLCDCEHKVAVLAIDPSSSLSKGSILGDKTRMELLSRKENAFIRPSPSGGTLGGVARKTRESMLVCEAAGYNIILIETIGVGQSEIAVRSMVDFMLLLLLPGGGDELQGIKKGSVELADLLAINKADGDNINQAGVTQKNYQNALHLLTPYTDGWYPQVYLCSALKNTGMPEIWENIQEFTKFTKESGNFDKRRSKQMLDWLHTMLDENIRSRFYNHPEISKSLPLIEKSVLSGCLTPVNAVNELLSKYR